MSIELTPGEAELLRNSAPASCRQGLVCFQYCPICGHAEWSSSDASKPEQTTIEPDWRNEPCRNCQSVFMRAPEIFNWVLNVIGHSLRMQKEKPKS